ncbi:MAG: shikimate dehydrogenase [Cyanobacteria bacterium P01_A01_bin.135]
MITGTTKLLGVIGHPIAHSLSPVMHNAAIAHLGADFAYLPFPIAPASLDDAVQGFAAMGLSGFNVTIPHKQAIMPLLGKVSDLAISVGAVNTVWRTGNVWSGTNTDVAGFVAPLQPLERTWNQALVLGHGGAARAVVAGCVQLGCQTVHVVGRRPEALVAFQRSWNLLEATLEVHPWAAVPDLLPNCDLVVNATPLGMHPHTDQSPLQPDWRLAADCVAYDLIYNPSPTKFLQQARAQGAIAIDGLEMLVQQGAVALELWLQQPAPVEVMRRSLQAALGL